MMCRCPSPTTNLIIPATLATAAAATNHCTFLPASQPPHVASGSTDRTRVSAMQEHAPALYPRDATLALCQLRPGVCLSVCLSSQVVVPSKCLDGSNWFFARVHLLIRPILPCVMCYMEIRVDVATCCQLSPIKVNR